jgi:hypothetical protein
MVSKKLKCMQKNEKVWQKGCIRIDYGILGEGDKNFNLVGGGGVLVWGSI